MATYVARKPPRRPLESDVKTRLALPSVAGTRIVAVSSPERRAQVTSPLFTDTKSKVGSTSYVTVKDTYPKLVPTSATKWHSAEFGYGSSRSGAVGDERNSPVGLVSVVVPRQVASEQSAPP